MVSQQTRQERWTETEKEIGRREGGNRKGKLGESLALVAGVAKGWLGWVGLEQGLERVSSSPLPMFGVEGPMREEGLYIRI